jgi:hypothetical protein|nr:MAG TPA: hypothetical protein [Caudoviricetes sp.]
MFVIPAILVLLNVLLIISYYYFNVIDRRNATTTTEKMRDEMREMDRKLIYGYWNSQNPENK